MRASAILRFARTIRLPMVGSATRKARAISPVVMPPERAQRERRARRHLQRGMAAGEDQPQPIVDDRALVVHRWLLVLGVQARQLGQPLGAIGDRALAAQ